MGNIDSKIIKLESKKEKYDKNIKVWRFFYKLVGYTHIGFSGPFVVNAIQDLFKMGSISGLAIFAGLLASFFISASIFETIIKNKTEKRDKIVLDLIVLNKEKKIKKETLKKTQNQVNTNYISRNNDFIYQDNKEMKLSLGKNK